MSEKVSSWTDRGECRLQTRALVSLGNLESAGEGGYMEREATKSRGKARARNERSNIQMGECKRQQWSKRELYSVSKEFILDQEE